MALIDITVKTLDGQNRSFSVPEQMTVRSFKEKISNSIEIPADTQRLIFHGRVMQDDKELREYDIHGKAVHVVQRAPPTSASSNTDGGTTPQSQPHQDNRGHGTTDASLLDVQIHFGGMNNAATSRDARQRIQQAEVNVGIINSALDLLEQRIGSQGSRDNNEQQSESTQNTQHEDMDTSAPAASTQGETTGTSTSTTSTSTTSGDDTRGRAQESASATSQSRSRDSSASRNRGTEGLSATDLADFLDRVLVTSRRMEPHIIRYRDYLTDNQSYTASSQEARSAQEVANRVMEAIHAMSHVMHSLSDVMVDMHTPAPRQAIAVPLSPFAVPGTNTMAIPIHMNVRTRPTDGNGRGQGRESGNTTTALSSTQSGTTPSSTTTTTTMPEAGSATTDTTGTTVTVDDGSGGQSAQPQHTGPVLVEGIQVGEPIISVHNIQATVMTDDGVMEDAIHFDASGAPSTSISIVQTNQSQPSAPTTTSSGSTSSTTSNTTTPGTTRTSTTGTPSTATAGFSMGPTTNVNIGGGAGGLGGLPNVPGLPGGMLQNIVQSILNNHGVQAGQPVQVNVLHPGGMASQIHRMPVRPDTPQTGTTSSSPAGQQNTTPSGNNNGRPSGGNIRPIFINRGRPTPYPLGPRQTQPRAPGSGNGTPSNNAGTGVGGRPQSQTPQAHHHHHHHHHHHNNRGFVDMFLPCSSHHYLTQTARRAARNTRNQPGQQQVPNLSTMVSGMVGDLIGQVGGHVHQHATAARNNGGNRTTTSASTAGTTSTTSANTGSNPSNRQRHPTNPVGMPPIPGMPAGLNPMLAAMMGGAGGGPGGPPGGPVHLDFTSLLANMMGANMNAGNRNQTANPSTTNSGSTPATNTSGTTTTSGSGGGPMGGTLADLFRQFTSQLGSNDDGDQSEPSFVQSLIECVAPHVRLTDLFSLVMGNTRIVGQLREPLRQFAQERVTQLGSVDRVVHAALEDMNSEIEFVTNCVEVRPGIDMAKSIRACVRHHLKKILEAILSDSPASQDQFGQELFNIWMTAMSQVIALYIYCVRDGEAGFAHMLQQYMPRLTRDLAPAIGLWMGTSVQDILSSFHRNHPIPQADIEVFVVRADTTTTTSTSQTPSTTANASTPNTNNNVNAVTATTTTTMTMPSNNNALSTRTGNDDTSLTSTTDSKMEVEESPSVQPPRPKVPRTQQQPAKDGSNDSGDEFVDAPEEFTSRPIGAANAGAGTAPVSRPTQIATTSASRVPVDGIRNGEASGQWQDVIPQEWIPVIRQDVERQKEQRSQPPLSDAYLQGLPAKRRRMMVLEHSGEMGNMPTYFPSAIARAARSAGVEPISSQQNMLQEANEEKELQQSLEQEVQTVVESRITSDTDFNSDRFPNSIRYFRTDRNNP